MEILLKYNNTFVLLLIFDSGNLYNGNVPPLKLTTQCLLIKGVSLVNALSYKLSLIFLVVVAVSVTGVKNQNCPICTRVAS